MFSLSLLPVVGTLMWLGVILDSLGKDIVEHREREPRPLTISQSRATALALTFTWERKTVNFSHV